MVALTLLLLISLLVPTRTNRCVCHARREVAVAGVDALIVQDWGAVELIRRAAPGLPIHGSTQMSITSAQGAEVSARSPRLAPCAAASTNTERAKLGTASSCSACRVDLSERASRPGPSEM